MDHLSKTDRSKNMASIKSKNTKPEIVVRKLMFSLGLRYRLHKDNLPGKPDIVLHKIFHEKYCYKTNFKRFYCLLMEKNTLKNGLIISLICCILQFFFSVSAGSV